MDFLKRKRVSRGGNNLFRRTQKGNGLRSYTQVFGLDFLKGLGKNFNWGWSAGDLIPDLDL